MHNQCVHFSFLFLLLKQLQRHSIHYQCSFLSLSLLAEYHELYELQRKRIEDQVGTYGHPEASSEEITSVLEHYYFTNSHIHTKLDFYMTR